MDRTIAYALLVLTGTRPSDAAEAAALAGHAQRAVAAPGTTRVTRGALLYGLASTTPGAASSGPPTALPAGRAGASRGAPPT